MVFQKRTQPKDNSVIEAVAIKSALDKVYGVIWFDLEGNILDANKPFLSVLGYDLDEIKDQHHRMFVQKKYAATEEYSRFWENLKRGEAQNGVFPRVSKDGNTIWIDATYSPVLDSAGKPIKIVKIAVDVTETKNKAAEAAGQLQAISKSQAVIEFDLDGNIQTANPNFLTAMGYELEEVVGKHHKIFVDEEHAQTAEYKEFWQSLKEGTFKSGEFLRYAKGGREIWIQATYNPIFGADGKATKVVKFASDITPQKQASADANGRLSAISKSQAAIEFDVEGNILTANDNFLSTMGYSLDELIGQHHRIFVEQAEAASEGYSKMWSSLANGEYLSGEFKRVSKDGNEIWINGSYNPIFDIFGKPYKIVKYAVDVTQRKQATEALVKGLEALAAGDLTAMLPSSLGGEFAGLRETFNNTLIRLDELVRSILVASNSIAEDTNAIATNANDLSTRGARQAAALEETSAAMEEMTASVKSTEINAGKATGAAEAASQNAVSGGTIVNEAVDAMARIESSTVEIGKIVQVIEGIAFQTNLLALNAGVEAARAGDAGRGFSVVASEVRALAHRSSESAREINDFISKSNTEVADGSRLVNDSGNALKEIVDGVSEVVGNISDIQSASQEQAQGVAEMQQAVAEIDRTTQHTAALAEESAAAATQLAERANNLREIVSYFKHSGEDGRIEENSAERDVSAA
ncbi:MAG: PAS domain S-box protein [Roseobacter sp.]